ncbi:SufD family Fe-S cluster assembly protein, partial [Gemmatimonadota bacterium]
MAIDTNTTEAARDHYLADFERLAAHDSWKEPAWLADVRTRAMEQFGETGFPSARAERWRFTNFAKLTERAFAVGNGGAAAAITLDALRDAVGWCGESRVVFVNGIFSPDLSSTAKLPDGVYAGRLTAAVREKLPQTEHNLAQIEWPTENPFAALNTAFLNDGGALFVPGKVVVPEPIHFLYLTTEKNADVVTHPRNLIVVGNGAEATVVESYCGVGDAHYWTNAVTEIELGDGARLNSCRFQLEGSNTFHTATTRSRQGRDSRHVYTTVEFGALLSRHDIQAGLEGSGAECALYGLSHLDGRQHVDQHTTIDHAQPHCSSRESFNGVFDGRSHGVFTGRILVRPGAQRTDAMQASRNL